ncbi:hypothetical protein BDQ12DRAFT_710852 [Crucibulum laeve]|uniref:Uncharacterized protein n=1 Tax=Crucibulum laeve TaxID=68775 RepID=A0A5C3M975_9AGAR|nr:hypothetical protein BDQ12DRAFT_710852 [Crucibulum laeve]
MTSSSHPPYYLLVSHSALSNPAQAAPSNALAHPTIQYHYTDDSPLSLVPRNAEEHVLVIDYDPLISTPPTVQSISHTLLVAGISVEEAPGASAAAADNVYMKNDRMFIIETISDERTMSTSSTERSSAQTVLSDFKRRNEVLRRALRYPDNISQPQE